MEIKLSTEELQQDFYTKAEVDALLQKTKDEIIELLKNATISFKTTGQKRKETHDLNVSIQKDEPQQSVQVAESSQPIITPITGEELERLRQAELQKAAQDVPYVEQTQPVVSFPKEERNKKKYEFISLAGTSLQGM